MIIFILHSEDCLDFVNPIKICLGGIVEGMSHWGMNMAHHVPCSSPNGSSPLQYCTGHLRLIECIKNGTWSKVKFLGCTCIHTQLLFQFLQEGSYKVYRCLLFFVNHTSQPLKKIKIFISFRFAYIVLVQHILQCRVH